MGGPWLDYKKDIDAAAPWEDYTEKAVAIKPKAAPEKPGLVERGTQLIRNLSIGAAKGAGSTATGLGLAARKYIPGLAYAGDKLSDWTQGGHADAEQLTGEQVRETLQLKPEGVAQKVGFGAEQLSEYFVPGSLVAKGVKTIGAGARVAKALPQLKKLQTLAEYGTRGALEAAPAVAIAKVQGQEDTQDVAMMAMAGPTFGKLLNKTGASRVATAAAKGVVGKVSQTVAEKIPEVTQSPRQMMWRALKPYVRNRDFDRALDNAMPEIYEQAKLMNKRVASVDDFLAVLKATKKRVWAPYQKFLGETNAVIDGNKIADAMTQAVSNRQALKNPAAVEQMTKWADQYRRKIGLSEAEDFLQNANAELQSFYGKYPAARHASLEADVAMAGTVKEAEALRESINAVVDKIPVAKVKKVYGGLSNLEQEAYRRVNVSKRLAPESLTEQLANVHAAGEFVEGIATGHPLSAVGKALKGTAYRHAARIIKERNTSDYLIKQAFNDFGQYVEKAKRAHRIIPAVTGVVGRASGQTP